MIERAKGTNARCQNRIDKPRIVIDPFLVCRSGSIGLDSRPRNRKTIALEVHLFDDRQVVLEEMVVITSDIRRGRAPNFAGSMTKAIPVRLTFSILIPGAFYLKGGCGCAPEKIFREIGDGTSVSPKPICPEPVGNGSRSGGGEGVAYEFPAIHGGHGDNVDRFTSVSK